MVPDRDMETETETDADVGIDTDIHGTAMHVTKFTTRYTQ